VLGSPEQSVSGIEKRWRPASLGAGPEMGIVAVILEIPENDR
jgi:hypothetical protein